MRRARGSGSAKFIALGQTTISLIQAPVRRRKPLVVVSGVFATANRSGFKKSERSAAYSHRAASAVVWHRHQGHLVQQVTQVCRRLMRRGDGQQHVQIDG
jgi:hypothetical protein